MRPVRTRFILGGLLLGAIGACAPASTPPAPARPLQPYTEADVEFINGMIPHHRQAIMISGWAPSHAASRTIQTLTERIVVGQTDDITLMRQWLDERNLPMPDSSHAAMGHASHMPGMLSEEQLAQLNAARGTEFDRLFLTFMIQHHQGALVMVEKLMNSSGAAQDDFIFKIASEISAEQVTEIERMRGMLLLLPS